MGGISRDRVVAIARAPWPTRMPSTTEHTLESVTAVVDIDRAREVMRQVRIVGEVQWPAPQPAEGPLTFQVTRRGTGSID
jgi:hypothetical protein